MQRALTWLSINLLQRLKIMNLFGRRSVLTGVLLGVVAVACGDEGEGSPGGEGGSGGSSAAPSTSSVECTGEFARVMDPYTPNTSLEGWGGFFVDEQGLVFSLMHNAMSAAEAATDMYPQLIMKSDLSGNMETLHTSDSMIGPILVHGDDVYFVEGLLGRTIMRIPRAGGEAVSVTQNRLWAGPVESGGLFYFAARPSADMVTSIGAAGVYSLDPETGMTTLLADQGDSTISAIAVDGGTIYWIETGDILSDTEPYALWSMPAAGGASQLVMMLPNDTGISNFRVIDGVAYGSTFSLSGDVEIHRTPLGGTPEVAEDSGGFPMLIAGDNIYYGALSGLTKNSLSFDSPTVIEGTSGKSIYSLAMGPTDLWYAIGPCIYRLPQ